MNKFKLVLLYNRACLCNMNAISVPESILMRRFYLDQI